MINGSETPINERDEAGTPRFIFNWMNERYHFDIGLCGAEWNAKIRPFFSKQEDGLSKNWPDYGRNGWCNPPYSDILPWILKAIKHREIFRTVFLIPAPNGENLYRYVEESATELILIHGRLSFIRPDGREMNGNPRGSCIIIFDHERRQNECKLSWADRNELERKYKIKSSI